MTTDNTAGATQADASSDTSAPGGQTTTPTAQAASGKIPLSAEEYERKLAEANKEAAANRVELKKYKEAEEAAKLATLTEQERLAKHAAELQSKYDADTAALTERIVRYEVERQASKLGIVDPDAAAKLIDWSSLEYDEDGTPTNAETLLKDLLKARPWLASTQQGKPTASSGGATNPSRSAAANTGLSWDIITKMTQEQYNARRPEIVEWISKNPPKRF